MFRFIDILRSAMLTTSLLTLPFVMQIFSLEKQNDNVLSFKQLVHNSIQFDKITPFPTQANRIATIAKNDTAKQAVIAEHAQQTRPIMHKTVLTLIEKFLAYKRKYGTRVEKRLYKHMTLDAFIERLLSKRPLMFMTAQDQYLLRNDKQGHGGFETIGTRAECPPLILVDYLSYDEMQIAALIGVSSLTYFINNGSRTNKAVPGVPGSYQETGVYVGLVGARFEKEDLMESQHILVTPKKSMVPAKLRILWEEFYDESFATFEQAQADTTGRYIKVTLI